MNNVKLSDAAGGDWWWLMGAVVLERCAGELMLISGREESGG